MRDLGIPRDQWLAVVALGGALAVGGLAVLSPIAAVGAAVAGCALTMALTFSRQLPGLFLGVLGVLLFAYAFLGKGAAYLGRAPLFVGELVLACGLLAVAVGGAAGAFRSRLSWLVVAFAAWGAAQTFPYLASFGADALRDAVVWGYGAFAILVAACLARTGWLARVPRQYASFARWFPLWVPVAWLAFRHGAGRVPIVPGSGDIPLIHFKPGDAAVHLAGAAAFVLLELERRPGERPGRGQLGHWMWWAGWLAAFAITFAFSRGAFLSVLAAGGTVLLLRPRTTLWRPALLTLVVGALFFASDISIEVRDQRTLSARQLVENVRSITGTGEPLGDLQDTKQWRLQWWEKIIGYTISGPYFWSGKGFGVNLAEDDGFPGGDGERSLRSPHNVHFTVLARSGVPGVLLWVLLHGAFAVALLRGYLRTRHLDDGRGARLELWVLAYWAAFIVNGTFDIFLEGPQGGIWFWSLFGLGIAALRAETRLASDEREVRVPRRAAPSNSRADHAALPRPGR